VDVPKSNLSQGHLKCRRQAFALLRPKNRVVIQQWDSVEVIAAYRASAAFKDLLPLREKLAKFRSFTVEGVPQ